MAKEINTPFTFSVCMENVTNQEMTIDERNAKISSEMWTACYRGTQSCVNCFRLLNYISLCRNRVIFGNLLMMSILNIFK